MYKLYKFSNQIHCSDPTEKYEHCEMKTKFTSKYRQIKLVFSFNEKPTEKLNKINFNSFIQIFIEYVIDFELIMVLRKVTAKLHIYFYVITPRCSGFI